MKKDFYLLASLALIVLAGCQAPKPKIKPVALDYDRPLPPGQLALRKIVDPAMIPDFTFASYETVDLRNAIDRSLNYMAKPSSQKFFPYGSITHQHANDSLQAFADILDSGMFGQQLATEIRNKFDVYISVGCDNRGTILFTGYYTPIFDGSLERTARFKYPLYKQPDDLVKTEDGEILGRKTPGGVFTSYPSRQSLENSGQLAGLELIWLADPFEVYVAHVQGSAKIRLPDGDLVTVGYSANNGHEYKSIAREMVKARAMKSSELSLKSMIDYFKRYPGEVQKYINKNPRFVFFRISQGAPHGSLNEPVTTMRTIATDKSIYPRACLGFLSTQLPTVAGASVSKRKFTGFVLDQDTGGAIRAPGRCDVYMGQGDLAGQKAGHTYQEGKLYYLFLKTSPSTLPIASNMQMGNTPRTTPNRTTSARQY